MRITIHSIAIGLAVLRLQAVELAQPESSVTNLADNPVPETESCAQPPPEAMAQAAGVEPPKRPWHFANIWWQFEKPVEHFESLEVDVTIDRDVPATYNFYISPCGLAKINGMQFYGGLQSNVSGCP